MELNDDSQTRVLKTECFKFTALFHERKKITTNSNNHQKNYDPLNFKESTKYLHCGTKSLLTGYTLGMQTFVKRKLGHPMSSLLNFGGCQFESVKSLIEIYCSFCCSWVAQGIVDR